MAGPDLDSSGLNLSLVREEWPEPDDSSIYFNSGSCGRKPRRVLQAIEDGWRRLNLNPTLRTFCDPQPFDAAREAIAGLLGTPASKVLLTQNSTQGLQLVLQSFLQEPGDQLITTSHEHGSMNTIARHLHESRGVVIREVALEPLNGERIFFEQIKSLITDKTRLVQLSEISCYSGWRPDLSPLAAYLKERKIPLLVDGAHAIGQGPCRADEFAFYVGSCHKWLGAPNGTGFLCADAEGAALLKPLWLSDQFYEPSTHPLGRFESQGTPDVVKWLGVAAACELQVELGPVLIAKRQQELLLILAERIRALPGAKIRTPLAEGETSGMLTVSWENERMRVEHLRDHLWEKYRIWTQPDFCYGAPGQGLRFSCHISIEQTHIDRLIQALRATFGIS